MITSIWEQGSNEFKLQPLTGEMATKAQETLGIRLPDAYLAILKEQNGGRILYNAYASSTLTAWREKFIAMDHIKGIGIENGILNNAYFLKEWDMPEGLILFSGDGHTWLAMDYRSTIANPPIVYVDNEEEQLTQIASNFDEFLANLYIEETAVFKEDEYAILEYSEQDFEKIVQQNNLDELLMALMQLAQTDVDIKWFSKQLLQLSEHPSEIVRTEVSQLVLNMTYQFDDRTLNKLVEKFEKDVGPDVQLSANAIKEKMDYSFEQVKQDIELEGMASFFYQGEIYHVNEHSNLWHLSDYRTDYYSFQSVEDLLEQATIKGKMLKEIWSQVKKV